MSNTENFRRWANTALLIFVSAGLASCPPHPPPFHVYLTWQGDTSTTITVSFHTPVVRGASLVRFDTVSRGGDPTQYAFEAEGESHRLVGLLAPRKIHHVELTGLEPGRVYFFVAGNDINGFSEERKFRTIPDGGEAIRFVVGGDMGVNPRIRPLLTQAANLDPMFALVGGDIAYADGSIFKYEAWDVWLQNWNDLMVTSDGLMIPMVLAIGNHEVLGSFLQPPEHAPFYFGYFPQEPRRSFFSRTFGDNIVLFVLDTGHVALHGAQSPWLIQEMANFAAVPHKFALYHVPLYPSFRAFDDPLSVLGRFFWLPIFDEFGLTAAFENHDHTHKRTKPLRNNAVDPEGTVYFGDGGWGRSPRPVGETLRWYEETASSVNHFWLVEVDGEDVLYQAINGEGEVFDEYP